jgi:hypothetical protein
MDILKDFIFFNFLSFSYIFSKTEKSISIGGCAEKNVCADGFAVGIGPTPNIVGSQSWRSPMMMVAVGINFPVPMALLCRRPSSRPALFGSVPMGPIKSRQHRAHIYVLSVVTCA